MLLFPHSGFSGIMLVDRNWPWWGTYIVAKGKCHKSRLSFWGEPLVINQHSTCPIDTSSTHVKSGMNQSKI